MPDSGTSILNEYMTLRNFKLLTEKKSSGEQLCSTHHPRFQPVCETQPSKQYPTRKPYSSRGNESTTLSKLNLWRQTCTETTCHLQTFCRSKMMPKPKHSNEWSISSSELTYIFLDDRLCCFVERFCLYWMPCSLSLSFYLQCLTWYLAFNA